VLINNGATSSCIAKYTRLGERAASLSSFSTNGLLKGLDAIGAASQGVVD
jgi:hypothetical protein